MDVVMNIFPPYLLSLVVSLGIGLIVGMEREFDIVAGKEHFAGIRGFSLMCIFGCLVAFLSSEINPVVLYVAAPGVLVFISVFHYSKIQRENFGIVTELSLVLVFFLGVMSGYHFYKEALAVAVIISALLTLKKKFRDTISRLTEDELFAFIKFIILSLLLLPFLPDNNYGPGAVLNPRSIGFVVVIVSSLSFVGYFIIKFLGADRGIFFTGLFGGTFSSTAVAWVFSTRSKHEEAHANQYASGILAACAVMFVRVLLIAALFNIEVFQWLLIPSVLVILSSSIVIWRMRRNLPLIKSTTPIQLGNPLEIRNAFLFGILYTAITLFVFYSNRYLGTGGLLTTGLLSGLADVDAIIISVSKLSSIDVNSGMAAIVILVAALSNTFFKAGIVYVKGTKKMRVQVITGLIPAAVILLVSMVVIYLQLPTP